MCHFTRLLDIKYKYNLGFSPRSSNSSTEIVYKQRAVVGFCFILFCLSGSYNVNLERHRKRAGMRMQKSVTLSHLEN